MSRSMPALNASLGSTPRPAASCCADTAVANECSQNVFGKRPRVADVEAEHLRRGERAHHDEPEYCDGLMGARHLAAQPVVRRVRDAQDLEGHRRVGLDDPPDRGGVALVVGEQPQETDPGLLADR